MSKKIVRILKSAREVVKYIFTFIFKYWFLIAFIVFLLLDEAQGAITIFGAGCLFLLADIKDEIKNRKELDIKLAALKIIKEIKDQLGDEE